mmetsp:Transcript_10039/g.21971  ORF Transcript_10039/g.21971 Transcript_10039/m.21971 type:complete len:286 (+) Transcript_10039:2893-3750(+)
MRLFFVLRIIGTQIFFSGHGQTRQSTPLLSIGGPFGDIFAQKHRLLSQDNVPRHARSSRRHNGSNRLSPKHFGCHGSRLSRLWINQVNDVGNVLDQDETSNVSEVARQLGRQVQQVVLTEGTNFGKVGVFEIGNVGFDIRANELFGRFHLDGHDTFQKTDKACGLALVGKVKVHTILECFDTQTPTMCAMFENQLFQIQKGSLVTDALSDLHQRLPGALTKLGLTFQALLIANCEINGKGLLQYGSKLNFPLYRQSNFESHGVRFCPNPPGVDQSNFFVPTFYSP